MIERVLLIIALCIIGVIVQRRFTAQHIRKAQKTVQADPIIAGLRAGVPAVVYFTTPFCVPCRTQQQPALARLQAELGEQVQVVQIDATKDPQAADRWGVFSAPTTFILDKMGQPRQVNYGVADTGKLRQQIETVNLR